MKQFLHTINITENEYDPDAGYDVEFYCESDYCVHALWVYNPRLNDYECLMCDDNVHSNIEDNIEIFLRGFEFESDEDYTIMEEIVIFDTPYYPTWKNRKRI